jgi:hypothetical protein
MLYKNNYSLNGDILIINDLNIENDIFRELDIDLYCIGFKKSTYSVIFKIESTLTFKKIRQLKKYFLDNLIYVLNVKFYNGEIGVQISKKYINEVKISYDY